MALLDRVMAAVYDRVLAPSEARGLGRHRAAVLGDLSGEVLEIGAGTGANLAHYPATVTRVVMVEPVAPMRKKLEARIARSAPSFDVQVEAVGAEALPFDDSSFDHVVSTLVLCTVPHPERTVAELRRVLRPGGDLRVVEHVAADGSTGRWQRRLRPVWKVLAGGCDLHRDTRALLGDGGFDTAGVDDTKMPGPSVVQRVIVGRAEPV